MKTPIPSGLRALTLLLLSMSFGRANVLQYVVDFGAATTGSGTPTGTFTYNTDTNLFENFSVAFSGVSFNFEPAANAPTITTLRPPCLGALNGGAAFFQALTAGCGTGSWQYNPSPAPGTFTIRFVEALDTGTFQMSATASAPGASSGPAGPTSSPNPASPTANPAGPLSGATQVSAEVPEPMLVLPVALVLGLLVTKARRQRNDSSLEQGENR